MLWEDKIIMVKELNKGNWEEAFHIFMSKSLDYQAMDMFITGIDLSSKEVKNLFIENQEFFSKEFIIEAINNICYRSSLRWAYVYNLLGYDDKEVKEDKQ